MGPLTAVAAQTILEKVLQLVLQEVSQLASQPMSQPAGWLNSVAAEREAIAEMVEASLDTDTVTLAALIRARGK